MGSVYCAPTSEAQDEDDETYFEDVGGPISGIEYCYCRQVRHGQMVRCDNPLCAVAWFHVSCVDFYIGSYDDTSWYCKACRFQRW